MFSSLFFCKPHLLSTTAKHSMSHHLWKQITHLVVHECRILLSIHPHPILVTALQYLGCKIPTWPHSWVVPLYHHAEDMVSMASFLCKDNPTSKVCPLVSSGGIHLLRFILRMKLSVPSSSARQQSSREAKMKKKQGVPWVKVILHPGMMYM